VASTDEIVRAVDDEDVELGLMVDSPDRQTVEAVSSFNAPLLAVVPVGHRFARARKGLPVSALEPERLALLRRTHGIRQILHRVEVQEGIKLTPHLESNSYEVLRAYVASGLGATVLPRVSVIEELRRKRVAAVPLEHPVLRATTASVVKRRGRKLSLAAGEFLKLIQQELGKLEASQG
jgi:DNA-binding transcriptional LysR family regulator